VAKNEETPVPEPNWKHRVKATYARVKKHVRKNETAYMTGALVGTAVVTFVVTRRVYGPNAFLAKKIVIKDTVMIFSTFGRDQGPPSWVIRCVETKSIFTSQIHAARAMGLDPSSISRHLNGMKDHVNGYHFVRVAIATPRNA
jgi:hypothetical protein